MADSDLYSPSIRVPQANGSLVFSWVKWINCRAICRAKPPRYSGCDGLGPLEKPLESMSSSHIARLLTGGL